MKSIQSRLFLMLLTFIIVPYFLSVLFIYEYTKNDVERHKLEISHLQMEKLSEELEQYFNDMINLPYILYRNPDLFRILNNSSEDSIYFNPISMEKIIENFYLMRNEIRQVRFYIDKNKEAFIVYNAMISARKSQPDLLTQDSMNKLFHSNFNYLIEPPKQIENYNNTAIVPQSDNTVVMTIHHKIEDVLSNEFLGIITIDIDLDAYARICDRLVQDDEESVLLIDSNDIVMYASDSSLIGSNISGDLLRWMNMEDDTKEDIILSKTLSEPLNQWKLVKITPSRVLFSDVRQTAYRNILVGIGVGFLGLLMIGIISYRITRPIKLLSKKVRTIEGGNTDVPFVDNRDDEIGHLEKHMKEMMNRINLHIEREYKLEIENRKNQFRALKSQVNPHFLFNALQSIGAVALRSNSPKIYQLVTSLSKMMRYSIRADQWVLVRDEVENIHTYLSLQMERFGNNINYSIKLNETILDMTIPSMILQPLVENFFKHCYEEGCYDAHLNIYGEIQGEILYLVVENDGSSMTVPELQTLRENIYTAPYEGTFSHEHIGLKNIHDRLILNYGQDAGLELDTKQGQVFFVRLVIPLDSKLTND
ncbi:histidine kinase [Anaerobacillus alkalidiazotrophicus]|uniref:Histidine kinase n=1 Tax=Anaerobacillus alkalidiazotrophicus TaxID=472963 RepID=A0A1S2MFE7_9BACI|nr:sensor histidine kinase [Anaerobacillus alkalidiazotrophicus]OIJ22415.1 histidine kinase [Anaerobacillus alkalidiazotrophicus]